MRLRRWSLARCSGIHKLGTIASTSSGFYEQPRKNFVESKASAHVGCDDPPKLAKTASSEEEHYRRVRDEIRALVDSLPEGLDS